MTIAGALDWLGRGMTLRDFVHDVLPLLLAGWGASIAIGRRHVLPWLRRMSTPAARTIRLLPGGLRRRRRYARRLRQLRLFDDNPRLLIGLVARRAVGVGIIGSAILLSHAMFAPDHIAVTTARTAVALRWETGLTAFVEWLFVTTFALVGVDTVERIEDWADPAKGRARLNAYYRGAKPG